MAEGAALLGSEVTMATISRGGWLGASAALLLLGGCADLDRDHGRHGAMHDGMHQHGTPGGGAMGQGMMGQGMMATPDAAAAGGHQHGADAGTPADPHDHAAGGEHGKAAGGQMGGQPGMMDKCRRMADAKAEHDHHPADADKAAGDHAAPASPGDDAHAGHKKGDKNGCPMRS